MSLGDFNYPIGNLVNEIAVMGNRQNRSLERVDILLQPLHTIEVQVVGRLVQQQNIRFFQQKSGKVYPGLLSTGQAGKFLNTLIRRNTQTIADFIHLHVHVIAAAGLEAVGQHIIFPQLDIRGTLNHLTFQKLHFPAHAQQLRKSRA